MFEANQHVNRHIMIVYDEPRIASTDSVAYDLEVEGFQVSRSFSSAEALRKVTQKLPDLVLLDVVMPDMDGFEILKQIRERTTAPIIVLTAKADELHKVQGLNLGADDYLGKPFGNRELAARIKAMLRRTAAVPEQVVWVDDELQVDFETCEAIVLGQRIKLRPTEYRLLYHLMSNAGRLMSHETLLTRVWGPDYRDAEHYVRLYVTYLRQKIEPSPKQPRYILSERGLGYRFVAFDVTSELPGFEAAALHHQRREPRPVPRARTAPAPMSEYVRTSKLPAVVHAATGETHEELTTPPQSPRPPVSS